MSTSPPTGFSPSNSSPFWCSKRVKQRSRRAARLLAKLNIGDMLACIVEYSGLMAQEGQMAIQT